MHTGRSRDLVVGSSSAPDRPAVAPIGHPPVPARPRRVPSLRSIDYLARDVLAWARRRDQGPRRRLLPLVTEGYLLIHVPKTGGTSVAAAFHGEDAFVGHTTARVARRALGPMAYSRLYSFGFVRDPLDRFWSSYRYLRAGGSGNGYDRAQQEILAPYSTLEQLVADESMLSDLLRQSMHFRPQHRFLCDPAGRVLVKEVGRFERLADDVRRISERAGVNAELPYLNASAPDGGELPLGRVATQRLRDRYVDDRTLFGYP
ncbi:MAG: sulfotransferase family 2 domain-containing protein [Actinomycetota bacterium]